MTNGREVDIDLIADYLGGALDGTPEAAAVEQLIADDPAWSRAYARTSAAIEAVRVDLGTLGADRDQMPADVLGRLEAVLTPVLPGQGATVVRLAERRRWTRRLVPVAVAAVVLGCVALGVTVLRPGSATRDATVSAGGGQGDSVRAPAMADQPGVSPTFSVDNGAPNKARGDAEGTPERAGSAPPPMASGTDYTRDTVAALAGKVRAATTPGSAVLAPSSAVPAPGSAVPAELRRLTEPAALATCLAAISTAGGQPAASVRSVDLARFEGSPAVVVLLPDVVWVSGPACGRSGPDTRYSTRTQGS